MLIIEHPMNAINRLLRRHKRRLKVAQQIEMTRWPKQKLDATYIGLCRHFGETP